MEDKENLLTGGQMTTVTKINDTVRRSTGPWSPAVHSLLKHLQSQQFDGAPQFLGIDTENREMLSFIDGDAGFFSSDETVPVNLWSDEVLVESAQLLRRYHDATVALASDMHIDWQSMYPIDQPREVICHNDFAPYNAIFNKGHLRAIIDFDTAAPGSRLQDIAYAVYSFAPLFRDEKCQKLGIAAPNRSHKLQLFCDAYGREYCDGVGDTIITRIQDVCAIVSERAAAGDPLFIRKVAEGHVDDYNAEIAFLTERRLSLFNEFR